jgi:ATP-dependent helicase/nuclease subunit B
MVTLDAALAANMTVLCANALLSQHLRTRYSDLQTARGQKVWKTPRILSWHAWLRQTYDVLLDTGIVADAVLSANQERLIWEDIISRWDIDTRLMRVDGAALNAMAAARICRRYELTPASLQRARGPETGLFIEWLNTFEGRTALARWRTADTLDVAITAAIHAGQVSFPETLVLAGFDDLDLVETKLVSTLQARGARVHTLSSAVADATVRRHTPRDIEEELDWSTRWAASQLRANPDARIAIACPDIIALRASLAERFNRLFPGARSRAFTFAASEPLSLEPYVHDALLFLRFVATPQSRAVAAHLLRSRAFAPVAETLTDTTHLIQRLHASALRELTLTSALRTVAQDSASARVQAFTLAEREARAQVGNASLREWSQRFASWLRLAGWMSVPIQATSLTTAPDESAHHWAAHEIRERFRDSLGELARLSHLHDSCDLAKACERLQQVCSGLPAQPSTSAAITVVPVEAAAHMQFDYLWVVGLDDEQWPRPATPNPLLPVAHQRQAGVPAASATQVLERATAHTEALMNAAQHVHLSHCARAGDREIRPSPLLAHIAETVPDADTWLVLPDPVAAACAIAKVESVRDYFGLTIEAGTEVAGGTRFLADQSDCPFRAYASHRLLTLGLEDPGLGLDRRDAGTLLHLALEHVWSGLQTSAALHALDPPALQQLISTSVRQALTRLAPAAQALMSIRYSAIEAERLQLVLSEWLALERQRERGFSVLTQESRQSVSIGPLVLDVRADRVDQLDDGSVAIIDYKSGRVSTKGWEQQRMSEPQVPLYAVVHGDGVAAAFIAQVRRGECAFKGTARAADIAPAKQRGQAVAILEDTRLWDERLESWRDGLEALAHEAAAGAAEVAPLHGAATCRYCALRGACRIDAFSNESAAEHGNRSS